MRSITVLLMVLGAIAFFGSEPAHSADLTSAYLHVYVEDTNGPTVNVHRITADWNEATVTWNNFGGSFDPAIEGSFTPTTVGWHSVEITGLVLDWLSGTPNYGLLLDQLEFSSFTRYTSREGINAPYLEVNYSTSTGIQTDILDPVADTFIYELYPDDNYGSWDYLYTGVWTTGVEKQSLIRFYFVANELGTPGYWKTHSEYGPAPYDDTWALLPDGADTAFFLSNQTYYEVLWTEPQGGNAYYILAHAYIAAELNVLDGATMPSAVQTAFNDANILLGLYTPAFIGNLKGGQFPRKDFLNAAEILDDYNNGLY